MKKAKSFIGLVLLAVPCFLQGQSINYSTTWLGSSTGTTPWMQNFINQIQVVPDGTIYTTCGWDEGTGGSRNGTYKDGAILKDHTRSINSRKVTDNNGHVWTIQNAPGDIYPTGNDTIKCDDGRIITDVDGPSGMAISNDGLLMVSEFGKGAQVHFYNVSGMPVLDHTFGVYQGFLSGNVPGQSGDLRFREMTGVGTDATGNIYVSMSSFYGGCKLQSYTSAGKKNWELNGLLFVDNGDFDPATNGKDVYTKSHHFVWDSTRPAGKEWIDTAYTLNQFKYPDDFRLHNQSNNPTVTMHLSSTWIRYKDGHKIMVMNDMFNEQLRMYRFNPETDGETAIPSVMYARQNVKPYLFNFDFFKFDDDPSIKALSYCEKRGTQNETSNLGSILDGHYLAYCDVDFGTGKITFTASTTSPFIGGTIILHADNLDGRIIGTLTTGKTGGWTNYKLFSTTLTDTITGVHKIYMQLKYPDPHRWPGGQPDYGEWIWTDTNGDGQMNEGEYLAPGTTLSTNGFWVDKAMDIWTYGTDITKIPCSGIDSYGNPVYNRSAATTVPAPTIVGGIKRMEYDSDHDIMYMISETKAFKYSNWSTGNTSHDWSVIIAGSQSMSIAGDYMFVINMSSNEIFVHSLADGKFAGKLKPRGPIGLIDIPYGVRAYKRSNGEYIVLAEEDSKGKILVYRFSTFNPNSKPSVNITKPTANEEILSASNLVTATASDLDGSIAKVQIFIDSVKVSDVKTYTWLNATPGDHYIFARAFDNCDDSTTSATIRVKVITTGIDNPASQSLIEIYPNPAKDKVYVKVSDRMKGIADISIIDSRGKAILTKKASFTNNSGTAEIDVSGISNGIYIVKVDSGSKQENVKLIIDK